MLPGTTTSHQLCQKILKNSHYAVNLQKRKMLISNVLKLQKVRLTIENQVSTLSVTRTFPQLQIKSNLFIMLSVFQLTFLLQIINLQNLKMKFNVLLERLKKGFKETFSLVLGFILISSLFYIRLVPKISRDIWEHMTFSQILFTLISIFFILLNIYYLLLLLAYINVKPKNQQFDNIILFFANVWDYLLDVLHNFYKFIWYVLESLAQLFFKNSYLHYNLVRKLAKNFNNEHYCKYYYVTLIALKLLPKIIFVIVFFYDVVIQHHLDATFKCIPLLLLPLLERFFIFILEDFHESHKTGVYSFVDREKIIDTDTSTYCFAEEYRDNPPSFVTDFNDFFFNHYLVIRDVSYNISLYKTWKYEELPYLSINLILCLIRLFIFSYMLYFGLR